MNVLNHLFLTQQRALKARRLSEAQQTHLQAKAYRGVPYTNAHNEVPSWGFQVPGAYRGVRQQIKVTR